MACLAMAYLMYGIASGTLLKNEIHNYLIYKILTIVSRLRPDFAFACCIFGHVGIS